VEFRKLHEDLGVEVIGFDVADGRADADVGALRAAYDEYHLLLFRGGPRLPPERQIEICGWFGAVNHDGGPGWSVLRNEDAAGRVSLAFHSDLSYTPEPFKGLSLHALELPPGGTTTAFVSGAAAWAQLPTEQQARLSAMTLQHRLESRLFGEWPEFLADHPVRLDHPRTRQPILYVTEHHAHRIHEVGPDESAALIQALLDHLYAPKRRYVHHWAPNDLLVWDNLALQHARSEDAELSAGPRALQRVAMADTSFSALLERARVAEAQRLAAAS
jgi:taurine dioxygenase